MSDLLFRAAQQIGVNFKQRLIELVVAPYEEKTLVSDRGSRPVFELFCRGAFDGIQRRPGRIKVNRDHRDERVVGKAVSLHPSRDEGLVAEVRIAKTELGEETLALASEEILDCSAGFRPMPDGEEWNRDRTEVGSEKPGSAISPSCPRRRTRAPESSRCVPAALRTSQTPLRRTWISSAPGSCRSSSRSSALGRRRSS